MGGTLAMVCMTLLGSPQMEVYGEAMPIADAVRVVESRELATDERVLYFVKIVKGEGKK